MKNWKDITLAQAQELFTLDPNDYEDQLQYQIEQLAILMDIDPAEIENWTNKRIVEAFQEFEFIKSLPEEKLTESFEIEGVTYKMTPLDELTLAQMVDIEELINLGINDNIHRIISVIWLSEGDEYKPDAKRDELMKGVNLEIIYGNLLFFYHIVVTYMNDTQASLMEKTVEEMIAKLKTNQEKVEQ
jgi:hypothetical protein